MDERRSLLERKLQILARLEDRKVPGQEFDVPVRIYDQDGKGSQPVLLYMHGGDSAGGNLAAAMLHCLGKVGERLPEGQMLVYPWVDLGLPGREQGLFPETYFRDWPKLEWFRYHYCGSDVDGTDWRNPELSPTYSDQLSGQPPALLLVAGQDPLHAEGHKYATKLQKEGVMVDLVEFPGQIHGFYNMIRVIPQGRNALSLSADWLKRLFIKDQ